ncbi:hypothetical protein J2X69_004933 [Algoriphagus sp. 4150]|uniref:hypothetical protein n=1 Tax=Algoriphagus sp. 4150 TaxID=2817756 RepID=UPI002865CFB5|nr:hypothetical protein [Algoriphagus sp. 4150]MDR7132560.1 hypothetical protein [Algoriphagus sp. 4150]
MCYYLIAVLNKNNIRWHVAFIIGATLVAFNPGSARLINLFNPELGLAVVIVPFIVPGTIIIIEKIKFKRPVLRSPYFFFLLFWTLEIVLIVTIPQTTFWQNAIVKIAGIL